MLPMLPSSWYDHLIPTKVISCIYPISIDKIDLLPVIKLITSDFVLWVFISRYKMLIPGSMPIFRSSIVISISLCIHMVSVIIEYHPNNKHTLQYRAKSIQITKCLRLFDVRYKTDQKYMS